MVQSNLQHSHGRGMNTLSEQYRLPADSKEMDLISGGLYPSSLGSKVTELLSPAGPSRAILDVGCGSGIWAIEMAEAFPHAQVIGVDLASDVKLPAPPNFRFVQMDITLDLPPSLNEVGYDIIHARCVTGHLKDPATFVQMAHKALKPGGLLILGDACRSTGTDKKELLPLYPNIDYSESDLQSRSWFAGWQDLWFKICYDNYQSVDALIQGHGGLSLIHGKRYFAPISWPGAGLEYGEMLGQYSYTNMLGFSRAAIPALLACGEFSSSEVEEWMGCIEKEFISKHLYMPWDLACGIKSP
ncbi:S-adenosyl-L-methionine-dependent methyltransferase [Mycena sp. CBHHK59/15]|nr:S-adenosyl-L-methionine-dependent methyltransferase [Mycena sp. CBHHK59/15]